MARQSISRHVRPASRPVFADFAVFGAVTEIGRVDIVVEPAAGLADAAQGGADCLFVRRIAVRPVVVNRRRQPAGPAPGLGDQRAAGGNGVERLADLPQGVADRARQQRVGNQEIDHGGGVVVQRMEPAVGLPRRADTQQREPSTA